MSASYGRRGLALLLVLAAAALAVGSASTAADRTALKELSVSGLGQGSGPVRSRVLTRSTRKLAAFPAGTWGGSYTVKSGARVNVYASRYYPVDNAVNQAAADFVDRLVHGSEISSVKIYFAPRSEVSILCHHPDADGCYYSKDQEIVTVGEDTEWSTVEEVLTHEYGHHVANNRDNYPWPAIAYGTKRWATYMGICTKEAQGTVFPGDEGGDHYLQNPGEGFAESFLHLNEVKLGIPETPWFYDPVLAPDSTALALIEQDVLKPWKENALKRWSGKFSRRGQHQVRTFQTPLDGVIAAQIKGPRRTSLSLGGLAEVKRVSSTLSAGLICGQRRVTTKVVSGGKGRFAAAAAIP
jgi:hypothetical protein